MPEPLALDEAHETLGRLLTPHNVRSFGIAHEGERPWGPADSRCIPLTDALTPTLDHDEREAPFVVAQDGTPDDTLLVSLTDEEHARLCAWAQVTEPTKVRGLGVDLAATSDFAGARGARFNPLIFTKAELAWADARAETGPVELSLAYAFSAKEAAFKSLAAPLRSWYATHTERLVFDVRDFELADDYHEVGCARKGAAARAMDAMGIACIELARTELAGMALTFAVALAR